MTSTTRVDPVTLQIVGNALASIADEMATTIFRTAHSSVVRDGMDFSASVCDAQGRTVSQAVTVPFHLGSVPTAMETLLERYEGRMRPGDVFLMNDPFDGGIHLQDLFVFKPVFVGAELIGFTCTTAHHGDVGGRLPGSSACDNTEIFQEGIRLPWLKLHSEGEPVEDVYKIVEANVRIPRMTFGDLGAQVAACTVAERELQALAARHGTAELAALTDALIDHTEQLVRQEIATWPDGTASFTDYLGSDGIDIVRRPDHRARDDRGRRGDGRPDRLGADGARRAQQHALVRAGLRLPGRARRADRRGAEHRRRVPADPRADEAGHRRRGGDAGRLLDARRHRLPRARRRQRRARAADPGSRRRRGRGRKHARDLRLRAARTAAASSSTSSSSAPGARRRRRTETTA